MTTTTATVYLNRYMVPPCPAVGELNEMLFAGRYVVRAPRRCQQNYQRFCDRCARFRLAMFSRTLSCVATAHDKRAWRRSRRYGYWLPARTRLRRLTFGYV